MVKGWMDCVFDTVDTAFSYWKKNCGLLISYLKESPKEIESLYVIWNAHTAFLICVSEVHTKVFVFVFVFVLFLFF